MFSTVSLPRRGALVLALASAAAHADSTPQPLPYHQDWSDASLVVANDDWSHAPGVEGFLGQGITSGTGVDPQTLLGVSAVAGDLSVLANQTSTAITNGDVAEFEIANPTIALQGSGTADAPYVLLHLNTTGWRAIRVRYQLRDIDGTADRALQQFALQYRVGTSGPFVNVPEGYVADATTGNDASQVSPVDVTLPDDASNIPELQVRVITSNAVGSDEWVGVDDIDVTGDAIAPPVVNVSAPAAAAEGDTGCAGGTTPFTFAIKASVAPAPGFDISVDYTVAGSGANPATSGIDFAATSGTATIVSPASTAFVTVPVTCDDDQEGDETFSLELTAAGNASLGASTIAETTILDDDAPAAPVTVAIADASVVEGNSGSDGAVMGFAVTVTGVPAAPLDVSIASADGGAAPATATVDYAPGTIVLTFEPADFVNGVATKIATFDVVPDDVVEGDETFVATIDPATAATITRATATGTILNDDVAVLPDAIMSDGFE